MTRTILSFSDVEGSPRARIDLPLLRLGDRLQLHFRLQRLDRGRTEVLDVIGEYRVSGTEFELLGSDPTQTLKVSAIGVSPTWRAVKNPPPLRFGPAVFPRTPIS